MPVIDGVGFGECTAAKQADFGYLVRWHLQTVQNIIAKAEREGKEWPPPAYWYFDITAGKGRHPETGDPGSPVIFAQEAWARQIIPSMFLFEREEENCVARREAMSPWPEVAIHAGDHFDTLLESIPDVDRPRLGLLYCDPSGEVPPFNLLAAFAREKRTSRIDILIYLSATTLKRCAGSRVCREDGHLRLNEYLSAIPKDDWILREPQSRHQWTFALGTKWSAMPDFPRRGMHKVGTPAGDDLLRRLTYPENYVPPTLPDL